MYHDIKLISLLVVAIAGLASACNSAPSNSEALASTTTQTDELKITSLNEIAIPNLRERDYSANIVVESLDTNNCIGDNLTASLPDEDGTYKSYMASFRSDGIRQYARLTIPDIPPSRTGFPFILFLHGYVGQDKAPGYSIGCDPDNLYYSELTDAFARAGFAVLSPGYRGHATVKGVPAEGLNYLKAFDQGAGVSTQFYAIDALNFVAGLGNIDGAVFPSQVFDFDMSRYFLLGHSQGGDAGLTFLAAIGEGAHDRLSPAQSALWSGTFLPRLRALEEMMPVALSPEAFLSGDGTWTGTAISKDGRTNANFIFGFPPDWIETPNPNEWTWQKETWSETSVASAAESAARRMYQELKDHVKDLADVELKVAHRNSRSALQHDSKIVQKFSKIGGYNFAAFLTEPIELHVPDKDHYSLISWNQDLCNRINEVGGECNMVIYPDNNHSLRASQYEWFSPKGTPDGYPIMVEGLAKKFGDVETSR